MRDSSDQIEKDYDFYDDFYVKKDMEEKPEPKDRAQLIDSLLEDPLHASFEVKFPMAQSGYEAIRGVSTVEFALPHPKDPKYFYILRRNPYSQDAYTYDSVFTCELSDKPEAN